eukprot:SAG31_NODE_306_length_17979_cov_7.825447_14_plen_852_part_00
MMAVSGGGAAPPPGSVAWPASPGHSCHSAAAGGRIFDIPNVSHAQCAERCDATRCGCFDIDGSGDCRGTRQFWGYRASTDRTAYSSGAPVPPSKPHGHPPPPPPLSPAVQKLALKYGAIGNASCAKVVAGAPVLPASSSATFMAAYQDFNGNTSEAPVLKAAAALLDLPAVKAFFALPDSFSTSDGLDTMLVKCAVISAASPLGLAEFAANGTAEEALVDNLLSDSLLMREMLVTGGPREGKYGEALRIYHEINKASVSLPLTASIPPPPPGIWDDRSPATMLRRLALGTALGHASPIRKSFTQPNDTDPNVDPVQRFLDYERAYKAGELDPAIEVLTTFECRHTTDADSKEEDLAWFRDTVAIYRPDNIAMPYHTRYAEAVHTDVAYGHPACASFKPGACNGHEAQIPTGGGECGPRAFFGRFSRKAFGLPTWGVTEPGHAAMSTFSPDQGWYILLGATWKYAWWDKDGYHQGGDDFYLQTQCRENRTEFRKVLRANWLAVARGDAPINHGWTPTQGHTHAPSGYGEGGLWSALALYMQKIAVNGTDPKLYNRTVPPSLVKTKVQALLEQWEKPPPPPPSVVTDADGSVTIPAAAIASNQLSPRLTVMRSACDSVNDCETGYQLLTGVHTGMDKSCTTDPNACSFGYEVAITTARTFYLTANFSTWQMNQDLFVSVNGASPKAVPVFYTVGWWNQTQPIEVTLVKGKNTLNFTRSTERTITFKNFVLHSKKPNVPLPYPPYTPTPAPPPAAYKQVAPATTCEKQGISVVPMSDCSHGCTALGFNFKGAKAVETPMPGCMVVVAGEYKGQCMYNTNTSARCNDPPCYDTQAGCITPESPDGCELAEICLTK